MNFPFMEMISTSNTSFQFKIFLQFFKNEWEKFSMSSWPIFKYVITDFSRALLNAVSQGWNDMTLIDYINLSYDWVFEKRLSSLDSVIQIRLCYAHLLRNISRTIKKHFHSSNNIIQHKLMNYFKFIMNESNYETIRNIWIPLNSLLNEKDAQIADVFLIDLAIITECHDVNINSSIQNDDENQNSNDFDIENFEECTNDKDPFYKKSKFYQDFSLLTYASTSSKEVSNTFFCPEFITEVLKFLFLFYPYGLTLCP